MCCGKRCQNMLGYEHVLLQSVEKESIEQCSEPRKHGNTIGIYIYIHNGNITNNVFFCRFYPTCPPIILSESEFRDSAPHGWSFWRNSSIVPHSKNKKHSFENCSILTVAYLAFFYFQLWSHIQLSTVHLDQIRKYCFLHTSNILQWIHPIGYLLVCLKIRYLTIQWFIIMFPFKGTILGYTMVYS